MQPNDTQINPELARVVEEITGRLQRGERVDASQYVRQYPEHADSLRELLPALEALDALGGGRDTTHVVDESAECQRTLGDFQLIKEIGRGGMGVVYAAEQRSLNRRVAIKVLPFAAVLDPRQLQRFKNEAQSAATLRHPHIVAVHAIGLRARRTLLCDGSC